jgi:hypothetical protein
MRNTAILKAAICATFLWPIAASAEWRSFTQIDRMSDKKETWIELRGNPINRLGKSVTPYIEVQCHRGHPLPQFKFSSPVDFGRVGVNYKFDNENIRQLYISIFKDGMTLPIFAGNESNINAKLKSAKRLRLEVFFTGQSAEFIDMNLTGAKDAYSKLGCR